MKKIIIGSFLLILSLTVFSTNTKENRVNPNYQKDVETIKMKMDSTFQIGKDIIEISSKQIKKYGLKNYIKVNYSWILPIIIFFILYLLWLKGKNNN